MRGFYFIADPMNDQGDKLEKTPQLIGALSRTVSPAFWYRGIF
jgi:hypothetical protein